LAPRRFLIGAVFLLALTPSATMAADAQTARPAARVETPYSTAFLTSGQPPWTSLRLMPFAASPTLAALVPSRPGAYGMIGLTCKTLSASGRLGDCEISVEPKGLGYEVVGEQVVRELRVDPAQAAGLGPTLKFVSIQVRASKTDGAPYDGPCWAPRCTPVPLPPPPPPSSDPPPSPQF
jgi:hypothetical protein